jgi:hypothetical protein
VTYSAIFEEVFYAAACAYQSSFTGASLHHGMADVNHMVMVLNANPLAVEDWERQRPVMLDVSSVFVDAVEERLQKT